MSPRLLASLPTIGFLLLGLVVTWLGLTYDLGTLGRPGTGLAPVLFGASLAALSIADLLSLLREKRLRSPEGNGTAFLIAFGALIVWCITFLLLGLLAAIVLLIVVARINYRPFSFWRSLAYAIAASVLLSILFVLLLKVRIPLFVW